MKDWNLNNYENPSFAKLIEISSTNIYNNVASVNTKEVWVLDWYNSNAGMVVDKYYEDKPQLYILEKEDTASNWKITLNNYGSGGQRVVQQIIPCDDIANYIVSETTAKDAAQNAINSGGVNMALRILTCYFESINKQGEIVDYVKKLSVRLEMAHTKNNTREISHS